MFAPSGKEPRGVSTVGDPPGPYPRMGPVDGPQGEDPGLSPEIGTHGLDSSEWVSPPGRVGGPSED